MNENTNILIRQYFPKKSDLTKVTKKKLELVMSRLNNRPRRLWDLKKTTQIFDDFPLARGKGKKYFMKEDICILLLLLLTLFEQINGIVVCLIKMKGM